MKGRGMMRGFWIKAGCLAAVIGVLLGYDAVLADREKDEEIVRLNARVGAMEEFLQEARQNGREEVRAAGADMATEEGTEGKADKESPAETEIPEASEGLYTDGEWEGEDQGFGGPVLLQVTVETGNISNIEILSAEKEDQTYLSMAEAMLPAMIEAQSADVDIVSGATFSSEGIRQAAAQALEKAEK